MQIRLAVVASHPVQYYSPLYRELAKRCELTVLYGHAVTGKDQARAGFGTEFEWDGGIDEGFSFEYLENRSSDPGVHHFAGIDTPGIGKTFDERQFDVVLIQGWLFKSFIQALFAARRRKIPVLVRGDSHLETGRPGWKTLVKRLVYPAFLRSYTAALYVGARSRAYWRHYGYPDRRLFWSPHCVDNEWFADEAGRSDREFFRQDHGVAPGTKLLLFVGKLIDLKRPLDLIQAAAQMRSDGRDTAVMIAGSGPLLSDVRDAAEHLGVPLVDLGFRNQSEMPAVYAAADLMVMTSDSETWGLSANEALACGTPILLSDAIGAAPDLVSDGAVGAQFRCGDVDDLAATASRLLADPPEPEALAARIDRYSVERAADGIMEAAAFAMAPTR